jgi:hypothetical protein
MNKLCMETKTKSILERNEVVSLTSFENTLIHNVEEQTADQLRYIYIFLLLLLFLGTTARGGLWPP